MTRFKVLPFETSGNIDDVALELEVTLNKYASSSDVIGTTIVKVKQGIIIVTEYDGMPETPVKKTMSMRETISATTGERLKNLRIVHSVLMAFQDVLHHTDSYKCDDESDKIIKQLAPRLESQVLRDLHSDLKTMHSMHIKDHGHGADPNSECMLLRLITIVDGALNRYYKATMV